MSEAIRFWVAKAIVEAGIGFGIVAFIFVCFGLVWLYSNWKYRC